MVKKTSTELKVPVSEENKLFLQLVSYLLDTKIGTYSKDSELATSNCFVKLTPELCEHIIELTDNCDDDDFYNKEIDFPYDGWIDVGYDEFRKHIGETIYLSRYGMSWDEVMAAKELPDHVVLEYPIDKLNLALDIIDDKFLSESSGDYYLFRDLKDAIELLKANDYSDKDIFKLFKKHMKVMQFLD